jgi:hypothetical protein
MFTTGKPIDFDTLRIRHEFLTVPDRRLTPEAVASLLHVSPRHAFAELESLVLEGFLTRLSDGRYARPVDAREPAPRSHS